MFQHGDNKTAHGNNDGTRIGRELERTKTVVEDGGERGYKSRADVAADFARTHLQTTIDKHTSMCDNARRRRCFARFNFIATTKKMSEFRR